MNLEKLNELMIRARTLNPGSREWEEVVDTIVSMVLPTRRITRPSSSSLSYICKEICQDARELLKNKIVPRLKSGFLQGVCLNDLSQSQRKEWETQLKDHLYGYRDEVLKTVLTHKHLDVMAHEAQRAKRNLQNATSEAEQRETRKTLQAAMDMLYESVQLSGRFARPPKGGYPMLYKQVGEESFNKAWLYFCEAIERYDPNMHFLAWFNQCLEKRALDVYRDLPDPWIRKLIERAKRKKKGVKKIIHDWLIFNAKCQPLESIIRAGLFCLIGLFLQVETQFPQIPIDELLKKGSEPASSTPSLLNNPIEVIRDMVERDRGDRYKSRHLRRNKRANFQAILLEVLNCGLERIDMIFWEEMSTKYAASSNALRYAFYYRWTLEFSSDFEDLF